MSEVAENPVVEAASIEMSPEVGELFKALCAAQKEIKPAAKNSENPFLDSSYANIADVNEALMPLHEHGIAITQFPLSDPNGIALCTVLGHESGQWMMGTYRMTPKDRNPQTVGSCVTYLRRYGLMSVSKLATTDDDGNGAGEVPPITDEQHLALIERCKKLKLPKETVEALAKNVYGCKAEAIPADKYTEALGWLETKANDKPAKAG